jgi:hypothetical protein
VAHFLQNRSLAYTSVLAAGGGGPLECAIPKHLEGDLPIGRAHSGVSRIIHLSGHFARELLGWEDGSSGG